MITRKVYLSALWLLSAGLTCAQTGQISTTAGNGTAGLSMDGGAAASAMINGPIGLAVDWRGNVYIADANNSRIRQISGGIITTVAGGGAGGDGGPATAAGLSFPCDVKVDSAGNLYISESCMSASAGSGSGSSGGSGSGGAWGGAVVNRIRRVDAVTGIITTIAGGVGSGFAGDGGPATSALLNTPFGLAIDSTGNLFIADAGNNRIRRIDAATGVITTVAGNGAPAFAGDGGPATAASLNGCIGVAVDSSGNLYIDDFGNARIRRVDAVSGNITSIAGSGSTAYNGDGIAATTAGINPYGVALDTSGNVFIADGPNNRVRMVDATSGLIWTVVGNGLLPTTCCNVGDGGEAMNASVNMPVGLVLSSYPALFVSELRGERVRQASMSLNSNVATAVSLTADNTTVAPGQFVTFTATMSARNTSGTSVTGTVVFFDENRNVLGSGTLGNGSATLTTSWPAAGSHTVTVMYFGYVNWGESISPPLGVTVAVSQSSIALTTYPNPAVVGQPISLTATVTPSTATGSVSFLDGSTQLGTATVSNGVAAIGGVTLTAGTHYLTAQYSGNAGSATSAMSLIVRAVTTVVVTSSVSPSVAGQAVSLTAAVTPATATGTIQFLDNSSVIGSISLASGAATLSISSLAAGAHSITASYAGDPNDAPSTSAALSQTVQAATSVALSSNLNPMIIGAPVTFTATVTPASATGTVQFMDGTAVIGAVALSGGSASYTTPSLAQGSHSITAVYSGDANDAPTTSPVLTQSMKLSSALRVSSSPNPSAVGQTVTFTANVLTAATGTIQFLDGSTVLATVPISSGAATYSTSTLSQGAHQILASYSGDATYISAGSSTFTQTVNALTVTTTAVSSSQNPGFAGTPVTFTATVSPATATGSVQFLDGTTVLGNGTLSGGSAQFTATGLAQGTHSITAAYEGDATNASSTSAPLSQVMKLSAGMTVGANPSPGVTGQTVTISATVNAAATGTVTFTDGSTVLSTVPVSGGSASYTSSALSQGAHTIGVSYSGDNTYMSQSTTFTETILSTTTLVLTSSLNPAVTGQNVTITATITPAAATGNVQFYDNGGATYTVALSGGTASYTTSTMTAGAHSITAGYAGANGYAQSYASALNEVVKASTTITLASSWNPSLAGSSPVTFTANVTPATASGVVQFVDGSTVLGSANLANGSANFSTSTLTQGSHSITAVYGGDANDAGSTSAALAQTVKLLVGMSVTVSPNPPVAGQTMTILATMNAAATGTVTFSDGSRVLATVTVASGAAAYSTAALAAGIHTLSITYSGDANYMSSGTSFSQTIQAVSSVALTSSLNPSAVGQNVTFTAVVTPPTATGMMQFFDGSAILGTVTMTSGAAALSTSQLTQGSHSIRAVYTGDSSDTVATSATLAQTVNVPAPAAPSNLTAAVAGSSQINLVWTASPSSGVTYDVYASTASGFAPSAANRIAAGVASTNYSATGLISSTTYYFRVTAVNGGGESAAGNQANATTAVALSCHVTYGVTQRWNDGFNAGVSIKNGGPTKITSWSLTWTWPGNQTITNAWNAAATQSGANATLTNESYNATINPGATVTGIGFTANYSGSNPAPTAFYVNGTRCQ